MEDAPTGIHKVSSFGFRRRGRQSPLLDGTGKSGANEKMRATYCAYPDAAIAPIRKYKRRQNPAER